MGEWYLFLYYAAVVAVIVRTITHEEIFKEVREWFQGRCENSKYNFCLRKLFYMPTCEFCLSFWVTLVLLVGIFGYRLVFEDWRGYLVSIFTTMGVANVYMGTFSLLRVDLRKERAVAERVERRMSA